MMLYNRLRNEVRLINEKEKIIGVEVFSSSMKDEKDWEREAHEFN